MENIFNRLQFVKHEEVFATREEAVNYVLEIQPIERPALLAEPMVLLYESEDAAKGPNVILAIGSVGDGKTLTNANRTFFIDTQKTEEEIQDLDERLEAAIKSLTLVPITSDTIAMNAEKTAEGTFVSGDVKIADYRIISGNVVDNIIETEGDKGIYTFVDMDYDPETFIITFKTTKTTKEFQLTPDQHVVRGWYSPKHESIFLELADGSKVEIDVVNLIDEWTVLPDSTTPILLTKTHVDSFDEEHDGVYDWQDILTADVRVADHIGDNIIHKDRTGRYLYVKGTADNIKYSEGVTVKEAIDRIDTRVSTSEGNLIYKRPDGIYAYAMLDYKQAENKLVFTYSDGEAEDFKSVEFQLNSAKLVESITYDPVNEVIVIRYIDAQGEYQRVEIPVKGLIEEWEVQNEGHNVKLDKSEHSVAGKDLLSADVKIHNGDNNILEDKDHTLYVNGIANNIKYDATGETTVKNVLDTLKSEDERIEEKLDDEITRSRNEDAKIENTIGTGFSTDAHETITYKFDELQSQVNEEAQKLQDEIDRSTAKDDEHDEEITAIDADIDKINDTIGSGFSTDTHETITYKFDELQAQVNSEADKLQAEIDRSISADTVHDGRLDAIDAEIGDGFGPRNTVRDEIDREKAEREAADAELQAEIDAVSADSSSRLSDVINEDESIDVETRNDAAGKPTIKVVKVNLSTEVEDEKPNIIKLNADGLYAGVDLSYEETANKLIFKTTNGTKEIQLESMSSIISIEYNPTKEAIVITYMTNGHEIKVVEIPVGDLIREWKPSENTDGAIKLTLTEAPSGTTGKDILYGEVLISDHEDNILINDGGRLYVSNSGITENAAAIDALEDRMDAAEADIDVLQDGLREETSARTLADEALGRRIDQEIEDRTADVERIDTTIGSGFSTDTHETITYKFDGLQTQVDSEATKLANEITRSTEKDAEHDAEIAEEIARATEAEEVLTDKIGSGFTTDPHTNVTYKFEQLSDKVDTEANKLDAEIARSTGKDAEHDTEIAEEIARASEAEEVLTDKIGTGFTTNPYENVTYKFEQLSDKVNTDSDALNAEIARSTAKDTEHDESIETLTNQIGTGFTTDPHANVTYKFEQLQNQVDSEAGELDAEIARSTEKDEEHDTAIANEITRATNAETVLTNKIGTGFTDSADDNITFKFEELSAKTDSEITRATSKDSELETAIANEVTRATGVEEDLRDDVDALERNLDLEAERRASGDSVIRENVTRIDNALAAEVSRSTNEDQRLYQLIVDEAIRATNADEVLDGKINDEKGERIQADADLKVLISGETAAREAKDTIIEHRLDTEIERSKAADSAFTTALQEEIANRAAGDADLAQQIQDSIITFSPSNDAFETNGTIEFNNYENNNNIVEANVLLNESEDNIIKIRSGLFASAELSYDVATNKIKLTTSAGEQEYQLAGATVIDNLYYDDQTGELVITYHDGSGNVQTVRFSVSELFNDWIVQNPSEKSAIELKKVRAAEEGDPDTLEGRILITDDRDGDGKPDEGSDNMIEIRNNGLYVCGSAMTEAYDIAECAKNELNVLEKVVIGHQISEECGSGYTYEPNNMAAYINTATSFNNADFILDQSLKKVEDIVTEISGDTECLGNETDVLYKLLVGSDKSMPECGVDVVYSPNLNSCVISAATSFQEADDMLSQAFCDMINNWFLLGFDTPTTHTDWKEIGENRHMLVDVRLSHGNTNAMTDDEFTITDLSGSSVDPHETSAVEFSDTNVIRIVDVQEAEHGIPLPPDNPYNGIYLSNKWNCGLYYDEVEDADAIAEAQAGGYKTDDYRTDTREGAYGYDYNNNVRQ